MLKLPLSRLSFRRTSLSALAFASLLPSVTLFSAVPARAQTSNSWTSAPNMYTGRYSPGIVSLPDGKVLVAGGHNGSGQTTSAQIYDPVSKTWTTTGSLRRGRNFPIAILVDEDGNGKDETPIFFGGYNSSYGTLSTVERYDTATKTFSYLSYNETTTTTKRVKGQMVESTNTTVKQSNMTIARELHTVTRLPDGKVLIVGGLKTGYGTLNSAEIYDPVTRQFTPTGESSPMADTVPETPTVSEGRFGHDAILLPDEKNVLVIGGKAWKYGPYPYEWPSLNTAEIYNIEKGTFTAVPYPMTYHRDRVTVKEVGGRILVVGGTDDMPTGRMDPLETEWFDPAAYTEENGVITFSRSPFTLGPSLAQGRMGHTLTPVGTNGEFIVVGGWSEKRADGTRGTTTKAERFTITTDALGAVTYGFVSAGSTLYDAHDHGAAVLPDGRVLIVGGKQVTNGATSYYPKRAEIYTP